MLDILDKNGPEVLWSVITPRMFDLAMAHSILSFELEECLLDDDSITDIVINDELRKDYGLYISIAGRNY